MRASRCLPAYTRVVLTSYVFWLVLHLLLPRSTWKTYRVAKGAKFATQRKKQATELTSEMIARWGNSLAVQGLFSSAAAAAPRGGG
jgi:hypothetical protein